MNQLLMTFFLFQRNCDSIDFSKNKMSVIEIALQLSTITTVNTMFA